MANDSQLSDRSSLARPKVSVGAGTRSPFRTIPASGGCLPARDSCAFRESRTLSNLRAYFRRITTTSSVPNCRETMSFVCLKTHVVTFGSASPGTFVTQSHVGSEPLNLFILTLKRTDCLHSTRQAHIVKMRR